MSLAEGQLAERLDVATAPLRVPSTLQLKAPRVPLPPGALFQRLPTWPHTCAAAGAPAVSVAWRAACLLGWPSQ